MSGVLGVTVRGGGVALLAGMALAGGLGGCGEQPAAPIAAVPVEDPGNCALTATQVGELLRSDAVLLREVRGGCEWGVPLDDTVEGDEGPVDPDEPWARVVRTDRMLEAERRTARISDSRRPEGRFGIRDRSGDLGRDAFQTTEKLKSGSARVVLSFTALAGGRWVVKVRMPKGDGVPARNAAVERAESLFDALP